MPLPAPLLLQLTEASGGKAARAAADAAAPAGDANPASLTLISLMATTGVKAAANIDGGYVTIAGTPEQVSAARAALNAFSTAVGALYGEVPVQEWMIPAIVGTKGANITQLQQATGAQLNVDKVKRVVVVQGPNKETAAAAKEAVQALVQKLASQRVVLHGTPAAMAAVIGARGANIKRLQEETGAFIDVDRDGGVVVIRGSDADAVASAVEKVKAVLDEAGGSLPADQIEKRLAVDRGAVGAVVGAGGSVIRRIQEETGARLNIDRVR